VRLENGPCKIYPACRISAEGESGSRKLQGCKKPAGGPAAGIRRGGKLDLCRLDDTEPPCCELGDTAASLAKIIKAHDVGSVPVCLDLETRKLVGICDRSRCRGLAKGQDGSTTQVWNVMTGNPLPCRPEDDLWRAYR
jgi:CBS domain-containing protein